MRKTVFFFAAGALALALLSPPALAQAPPAGKPPPAPAAKGEMPKLTITGQIATGGPTGYVIQGQKPPEVFTIHNPDPKVLDKLVKSGKTVTLETRIILGDNVLIQKIDGKKYQGGKKPQTK
jgi:hypothetical protein